jgi:hypothetical protein
MKIYTKNDVSVNITYYCEMSGGHTHTVFILTLNPNFRGSTPDRGRNFSLHHRAQTGSGARPASYAMGTGDFPGDKAAEA